jgi:putative radical SAM enzyme (TIGR03279 family)
MVRIVEVEKHSLAKKAGIKECDLLISINDNEINDVLDYRFYLAEKEVTLSLKRGEKELSVKIKKDTYDDIGLVFETPLMDKKQSCKNKCIFCFIDQLPKGMRETLYFKDDDSRLSFLHGNYITLTNLTDKDIDRIIKMRFSPINVSIHTTNPDLRVSMMKNKRAGEVLSYLDRLAESGIKMHGQIVLCRGVNDGKELDRSMRELARLYPALESVSIVPAGLTDHRDGLYPLTPFSREECREVISQIDTFAESFKKENGSRLFFAADELYLKAELDIPQAEYYEEYSQIENGVGMLRSLRDEFDFELSEMKKYGEEPDGAISVSIATGYAAYNQISEMKKILERAFPEIKISLYPIKNNYFGEHITVAGLLTGKDIFEQLEGKELGERLLIPANALRYEKDLFLCGMSVDELKEKLGVDIIPTENDGYSFVSAILCRE